MGTAKVTATSKTNKKKKATITVQVTNDVLVKSITLDRTKITVDEFNDEDIQLKIKKILPANAENKDVVWSSENEDVADVDDEGLVTTGDVGETRIIATADDKGGAYATCKVIVTENTDSDEEEEEEPQEQEPAIPQQPAQDPQPPVGNEPQTPTVVPITGIHVSVSNDRVKPGESVQISHEVVPGNTTQTEVVWTAMGDGIRVGQDGLVTIDSDFSFDKGQTEKEVVVTVTSKENPSIAKSIILYVYDPEAIYMLESPEISLDISQTPAWVTKGEYGTYTQNEDGTVTFNSQPATGNEGKVFNNSCAWYLNDQHARVDLSTYKYVGITVSQDEFKDTNGDTQYGVIKAMGWAGGADAESYWAKNDAWAPACSQYHENGNVTMYFAVSDVFTDLKKARAIGVTVKSYTKNEDTFTPREVTIYGIKFMETLPEGFEDLDAEATPCPKMTNAVLSMKRENETEVITGGEYGSVSYEDGYVHFDTDSTSVKPYEALRYNNGCGWLLSADGNQYDVSDYNYVAVTLDSEEEFQLLTWSGGADAENFWDKNDTWGGQERVINNLDGSVTIYYENEKIFKNTQKARAIGFSLRSEEHPYGNGCDLIDDYGYCSHFASKEAVVHSIEFVKELPAFPTATPVTTAVPDPTAAPIVVPTAAPSYGYQFTDCFISTEENADKVFVSNAEITAVHDAEGVPCTELSYTKNYQKAFFELPEEFDLSLYDAVSITANVPSQIAIEAYNSEIDTSVENWHENAIIAGYPFYGGSETEEGVLGKTTQTRALEDLYVGNTTNNKMKYLAIGSNAVPSGGYGTKNFLVYSIKFTSEDKTVPTISFYSREEGTVTPSRPIPPKPTVIIEPQINLNNITEFSTSGEYGIVVMNEDGTVSFSSETSSESIYNNGVAWYLSSQQENADISEYPYVAITVDTDVAYTEFKLMTWSDGAESSLFWDKKDTWGGVVKTIENADGSKTIYYPTQDVFADVTNAGGIGITLKSAQHLYGSVCDAMDEEGNCVHYLPKTATIHAITFVKDLSELPTTPEVTSMPEVTTMPEVTPTPETTTIPKVETLDIQNVQAGGVWASKVSYFGVNDGVVDMILADDAQYGSAYTYFDIEIPEGSSVENLK